MPALKIGMGLISNNTSYYYHYCAIPHIEYKAQIITTIHKLIFLCVDNH